MGVVHVVFSSFVHPHFKKTKQTHVNFSSFESLIRPLSHQHHSAIYTFYNHESPSFYESTKKKRIKTTAIWCPKHHSTYLSSTLRFYVALLPAPKTTITLLLKIHLLSNINLLPTINPAHYNKFDDKEAARCKFYSEIAITISSKCEN